MFVNTRRQRQHSAKCRRLIFLPAAFIISGLLLMIFSSYQTSVSSPITAEHYFISAKRPFSTLDNVSNNMIISDELDYAAKFTSVATEDKRPELLLTSQAAANENDDNNGLTLMSTQHVSVMTSRYFLLYPLAGRMTSSALDIGTSAKYLRHRTTVEASRSRHRHYHHQSTHGQGHGKRYTTAAGKNRPTTTTTAVRNKRQQQLIVLGWSVSLRMMGDIFQQGDDRYIPCSSPKCLQNGGVNRASCLFTGNRTLLKSSDAILFHASEMRMDDLPASRYDIHKWIFYTKETPRHHLKINSVNLKNFDWLFNVTMTYSLNSTVPDPYAVCKPLPAHKRLAAASFNQNGNTFETEGKSKMAVWFVSNCETENKREVYIRALQKHVSVDIFGACGDSTTQCSWGDGSCASLYSKYSFYVAFENSNCRDYITEKVFRILIRHVDVVPVVYGGADYASVLPPHSYINVFDYASVSDLASYLLYLSSNVTAYSEYFAWRQTHVCSDYFWPPHLCDYLHETRDTHTVIPSVHDFWSRESQCTNQLPAMTS